MNIARNSSPLMVVLTAVFSLAFQVRAATVTVSNAAQLVAAVNNNNNIPSGGGVIVMNAGTYNFNSSLFAGVDPAVGLDIASPLTLTAASGAAVTLNFANNYGVRIIAPNVTLNGFTIIGQFFAVNVVDFRNLFGGQLSGIVIRGLTVSTSQNGQAISSSGMVDSIIENCNVTSTVNNGISIDRGGPSNVSSNRNLIINNTVSNTSVGSGVAVNLSDYNTIAGNTFTNMAFNGVFVNGGQHNYVSQNTMDNGLTFTTESASGRQALRNLAVNNTITLKNQPNSDALWFNLDANYNLAFLNDGSFAGEGGMALFNSVGNVVRANNFHNNAFGGLGLRKDPGSGPTTPTRNSIQQNYLHNNANNGGIVTSTETQNDFGFNYLANNPNGIQTDASTNSVFYSNIISNTNGAEQLQNGTTGATFYLNRHFNAPNHFVYTGSSGNFDSGSTTLGGNYYSDFTSANGNPSNGATPYTNIFDQFGATGVFRDRYPYASENLGKSYNIALRLPSAGSYLATQTQKTIAWASQGCVAVDLFLLNTSNAVVSTIASNAPDYGYYLWTVPNPLGTYKVRADCKTSSGAATGKISIGPTFQTTTPDLLLLSPQSNLVVESGTPLQVSWRKTANVLSVDVYIRYSDSQAYSLLQAGVTNDFYSITAPATSSNRASVRIAYGGYGDSTDGWFTIRSNPSAGQFTTPASANNLFVGTPVLVEWISPQNTDYVTLDLISGGSTRNIVTQLGDFSSYLMLVPDLPGTGAQLRLSFYNSAGSLISQVSSAAQNVQNSSLQPDVLTISAGNTLSAAVYTTFATPLQVTVTNRVGTLLAGVAVQFTAPVSGGGGSFGGSTTVITNGSGVATAPAFTANGVTGTYNVTAAAGSLTATFTLTNSASGVSAQMNVGYYYNANFVLDANGSGAYENPPADKFFFYISQQPGDIAVVGDWNGNGKTKVGIYRNGFWILDYNGNGVYDNDGNAANDKFYGFGGLTSNGYLPIVGDWSGDGKSKIGFYRAGFWALDYNGNGTYDGTGPGQDRFYGFGGNANEFPILGDWNHDGRTKVGIFYNGNFVLDYDGDGIYTSTDKFYPYISYTSADKPVIGDWNGNGFSKIGIYRNGFWVLDYNGNGSYDGVGAGGDKFYGFGGNSGEIPLVGDWNGDGKSKVGFYLHGFWALDYNGNGSFDGSGPGQDRFIAYGGNPGEQPLIGKW